MSIEITVVIAILVLIILILLAAMLFSGNGAFKMRQLSAQVSRMSEEIERLNSLNASLRSNIEGAGEKQAKDFSEICSLVQEFENVEMALAGSSSLRRRLAEKYGAEVGPELVDRIFERSTRIDPTTKERLANEIFVGETGKAILKSLDVGAAMDRVAMDAGLPPTVARSQIVAMQILGYIDERLKPTEKGRRALA